MRTISRLLNAGPIFRNILRPEHDYCHQRITVPAQGSDPGGAGALGSRASSRGDAGHGSLPLLFRVVTGPGAPQSKPPWAGATRHPPRHSAPGQQDQEAGAPLSWRPCSSACSAHSTSAAPPHPPTPRLFGSVSLSMSLFLSLSPCLHLCVFTSDSPHLCPSAPPSLRHVSVSLSLCSVHLFPYILEVRLDCSHLPEQGLPVWSQKESWLATCHSPGAPRLGRTEGSTSQEGRPAAPGGTW